MDRHESLILDNLCENDLHLSPNEDYIISRESFAKSDDFMAKFETNDMIVYESIQTSEDMEDERRDHHLIDTSIDNENENQFCVNNCETIMKRLVADNEELKKLKDQLMAIEEQNVELIKAKQTSDSERNQLRESFEKKILLKTEAIDDLKKSLYIFESLNTSLHKELQEKRNEKLRLESYVKEIEDKLYFFEMRLIECQKNEEDLLTSYKSVRQAYSKEEDNKYKTLEELQTAYVECAQQQSEIKELKHRISDLERDIEDRDNELWFYKSKFDESIHNCDHKCDRNLLEPKRPSILINKTTSEIPDYSFSVNEDEMDHIFDDFNEDNLPKPIDEESNEFESLSEIENIDNNLINDNTDETDEQLTTNLFQQFIHYLAIFWHKIPLKIIFVILLAILLTHIVLTLTLSTRLPAYTSWEEIIYRLFLPYLTKVKISKTQ